MNCDFCQIEFLFCAWDGNVRNRLCAHFARMKWKNALELRCYEWIVPFLVFPISMLIAFYSFEMNKTWCKANNSHKHSWPVQFSNGIRCARIYVARQFVHRIAYIRAISNSSGCRVRFFFSRAEAIPLCPICVVLACLALFVFLVSNETWPSVAFLCQ